MGGERLREWYRGKSILVTGGTGFMGKVLIEKLLRSCPDIGTIYVLCRNKNGKTPITRLADLIVNSVVSKFTKSFVEFVFENDKKKRADS